MTIILIKFVLHLLTDSEKKPLFFVASLLLLSACQTAVIQPQLANKQQTPITDNIVAENVPRAPAKAVAQSAVTPVTSLIDIELADTGEFEAQTKPVITAQAIAQKIANENDLGWSELDTEASTNTAAQLRAEAQEKAKKSLWYRLFQHLYLS